MNLPKLHEFSLSKQCYIDELIFMALVSRDSIVSIIISLSEKQLLTLFPKIDNDYVPVKTIQDYNERIEQTLELLYKHEYFGYFARLCVSIPNEIEMSTEYVYADTMDDLVLNIIGISNKYYYLNQKSGSANIVTGSTGSMHFVDINAPILQ